MAFGPPPGRFSSPTYRLYGSVCALLEYGPRNAPLGAAKANGYPCITTQGNLERPNVFNIVFANVKVRYYCICVLFRILMANAYKPPRIIPERPISRMRRFGIFLGDL